MIDLFLFQEWTSSIGVVWAVVVVLIAVVFGTIILLSKNILFAQETDKKRADASDNLIKTRDIQITDIKAELDTLKEEFEELTVEYRTIAGIKIEELIIWQTKHKQDILDRESEMAKMENVQSENRRLKLRLGDIRD